MNVEELLWRLADKYAPAPPAYSVASRPTSFEHAGDLVVLDGPITWETPWRTEGGFTHQLPAGSHPVYVGCADVHDVTMVVIPVAEPSRIAAADWSVPGYHDVHLIEEYAVLWGEEAMRASLPHPDGIPPFARDVHGKGPVVLDQETGANAFVFPVSDAEYVTGYEIVDDRSELLCLVLAACE